MEFSPASLFELLHRATQASAVAYTAQYTGDTGLTLSQFFVLSAIEKNDGASQTALVAASGIDRSTLSGILDRMQKQGYVTRKRVRTDARIYAVKITEGGRRQLDAARKAVEAAERTVARSIPPQKLSELQRNLQSIVDSASYLKHNDDVKARL